MSTLLIIQADDGGVHSAVDRGVLLAIDQGPVTSVGLVAGGSTAPELARELRRRPEIGIGLHFALTGIPACASTRLAEIGHPLPKSWRSLARKLATGGVGREDIEIELRAQIERARALNLRFDHVGGHEHVHLLPGVADVVARLVRQSDLPPRVRISRTPHLELVRDPRAVALRAASSFARRTAWQNFLTTDRVVGVADLGSVPNIGRVVGTVSPRHRSVELMVHPGDHPTKDEPPLPEWEIDWTGELDALITVEWRKILSVNFVLGTYRDL